MLAVLAAACGASTSTGAAPTPTAPSPSASAAPTSSPAATPIPEPTPSPSAAPAGFVCTDMSGGTGSRSGVTAIRIASHPGYDRFVIQFGGPVPDYKVTRQATSTFTLSPKGEQVTLLGGAGVLAQLQPVPVPGYSGRTDFQTGLAMIREARLVQDFEGIQQWGLGIQGTPCLRVFTLGSPDRLVIDVSAS